MFLKPSFQIICATYIQMIVMTAYENINIKHKSGGAVALPAWAFRQGFILTIKFDFCQIP